MRNFRFGMFLVLALLVIAGPLLVFGEEPKEGIVPCGGTGQGECRACDFVKLGQNLINWFIAISASTIALTFAVGGMKMAMSGGDTGAVSSARSMMTNSVIGLIIILGSWLIVDTMLKLFLNDQSYGVWNEVQCVARPVATTPTPPVVGSSSGYVAGSKSSTGLTHGDALTRLESVKNINVTSTAGESGVKENCSGSGCTTLAGIKEQTVQQVLNIASACPDCSINVVGATEGGVHSTGSGVTHANGYKVDIDDNSKVDSFLISKLTADGQRTGASGGPRYKDKCGNEYVREATHWDISVSNGSCAI
jgi:hypothetical protein